MECMSYYKIRTWPRLLQIIVLAKTNLINSPYSVNSGKMHTKCGNDNRQLDGKTTEELSNLAFIDYKDEVVNPIALFNEWLNESLSHGVHARVMNLATSSRNGYVANRTVALREVSSDGSFCFITNNGSTKSNHINENPHVALTFLWQYKKDDSDVVKQVRVNGIAEKLPIEIVRQFYEREPVYCKIRSHICQQGEPIDWETLKQKHDELLNKVLKNEDSLDMPQDVIGYKVHPKLMDFHFAKDHFIGDRLKFQWSETEWTCTRICV